MTTTGWMSKLALLVLLAGTLPWTAAAGPAVAAADVDWEGLVGLEQGVWGGGAGSAGQTLWLRIEKQASQWLPVWGYSRNYSNGDYLGVVTGSTSADGQTELAVRMVVDF